jgi:peptidyl-prolyl cis-trans isomerase SurA
MVSRAGDDAVIRHILRIPPVTEVEVKESMAKLDSVRAKLIAGTLQFGEAVSKYSEDEGSKFNGGQRQGRDGSSYITIDQLDKEMVFALQQMKVGEYSLPFGFVDERGRKAVRILHLKTRTQPHRENLKDDYSKISMRALEEKRATTLEKWFVQRIPTFYISIDNEFKGCQEVKQWIGSTVVVK